jgi:hypothetical protein
MSIQKEAFHLVVAFLEEGVEVGGLQGLTDIVATLGTAKLQDRQVILRRIGLTYGAVAAAKNSEWWWWENRAADACNEFLAVMNNDPDLEEEPTQEARDSATHRWITLSDQSDRVAKASKEWLGQIGEEGMHFCELYAIVEPTLAKWASL